MIWMGLIPAIIAVLFTFSPVIPSNANGKYCDAVYEIQQLPGVSIICARQDLTQEQINVLNYHVDKILDIYPKFIRKYGFNIKKVNEVAIIIVSSQELNSIIFPHEKSIVLAGYFPDSKIIYITPRSLHRDSMDIPHEFAHILNDGAGIVSESQDEKIAYEFEAYYQTQQ